MRSSAICAALLVLGTGGSFAQRTDFGGGIGGGAFSVSSGGANGAAAAGLEACFFCPGRLGLFAEYAHWFSAGQAGYTDRVRNADLAGAGLRIQWRERTRVFLDIGLAGGRDRHAAGRGGGLGGVVVGTGVRIPWGGRWYVRPQFRLYGLSPHSLEGLDAHWAAAASIGLGYRF